MPTLNVRWSLKSADFCFVELLGSKDYLGFLDFDLKKFTLLCLKSQEVLWVFNPKKRANSFGSCYSFDNYIFLEENDTKGDFWHVINSETGESKIVEGLGEWTYFRFNLDGYGVFEVDDRPVVIDPVQAKPIEIRGRHLEFSPGFNLQSRCAARGKFSNLKENALFLVDLKIETGVAHFGQKIELKGDPKKGALSGGTWDETCIVSGYYKYKTKPTNFSVFDWNGKLVNEIDLSVFLSEGDSEPQGMAAGNGKFVFHARNRDKNIDKFIGIDPANLDNSWLRELDMAHSVGMDKITQAGRYVLSPIGKGGLKKDFLLHGKITPTDDCVTRMLDIHTGKISIIHDNIGEYVVGTNNGIYYRLYSDSATLCYGELGE